MKLCGHSPIEILVVFLLFLPKIDNFLENIESNLIGYLTKWKPDCQIVLVKSCQYVLELKNLDRLVKHNPRLSLQLIIPACEDVENTIAQTILSKRNQGNESFYIFSSNESSEILSFLKIVNQVEKDARLSKRVECRKIWPPGYFFVWPENSQNSSEVLPNLLSPRYISNLTTHFQLNSNAHFVFHSQNENEKGEPIIQIFEFYNLQGTKMVTNEIHPENFGRKGLNRMNFHGIQLRATAPKDNMTQGEIIWGIDNSTKALVFTAGFGTSILKSFQHSLNFEVIAIPTDQWAKILPNKTWMGMANEILQGRADIGIAKTSILKYRAEALGYLIPIHTLIVTAFFRQPPISSTRNIFIHPFETRLWIIIICTWIVILVSIVCLALCKLKNHDYLDENDEIIMEAKGIWAIMAITQHGFYRMPHSISLRIVVFIGIFFGIFIFVAYSATLVSIFTSKPIPIKTFKELVTSPLIFKVDDNNVGAKLVSTHNSESPSAGMHTKTAISLMDKVSNGGNHSFVNATVGGALMFNKNIAFLTFKDTFYSTVRNSFNKTDQFLCNTLTTFSVTNTPFRSGLFVAKNSPYKELFNNKIICLYSSGIMRKYVMDYQATYTPICNPELEVQKTPSLGPNDVFFSYILLICGFCASVLSLVAEILYFRRI